MGVICACQGSEGIPEFGNLSSPFQTEQLRTGHRTYFIGLNGAEEDFVLGMLQFHVTDISSQFRPVSGPSLTREFPVLIEGELLRYLPGASEELAGRWCTLTNDSFLCYKNQFTCKAFPGKPLGCCTLGNVTHIELDTLQRQNLHSFEFILKLEDTETQHLDGLRESECEAMAHRFVFALNTPEERDKWVGLAKKALSNK